MDIAKKTVLMLQPLKFQALVWRAALTSQRISVISASPSVRLPQILRELVIADVLPDLLLVDLEVQHPYNLCRWCHKHYPHIKIVMTSGTQKEISSTERRWAIYQGAEDLLAGFQPNNLFSNVTNGVSRILEILEYPPLQETTLIPVLLSLCKDISIPVEEAIEDKSLERTEVRAILEPEKPLLAEPKSSTLSLVETTNRTSTFNSLSSTRRLLAILRLITVIGIILSLVAGLLWWLKPRLESKLENSKSASEDVETKTSSLTTFQTVTNVPSGLFNYGGSTTWSPIRQQVDPLLQAAYPQFQLRYVDSIGEKPGSGTGIRMLLDGQLDFSQSSRPLKPEEYAKARQQGFTIAQYPVAIDGIAIVVNPSLSLAGLSIEQLKQIYSGQIINWKEVGGPDLPITPFSRRPEDSGTAEFFQESILQEQPFSSRVKYVYSTTDAIQQLAKTPGGIYYASAPEVVPQCTVKPLPIGMTTEQLVSPYRKPWIPPQQCPHQRNQLDKEAFQNSSYPLTRRLFVIVKQNQSREEQAGKAYVKLLLTDRGQQLVEEAGFVPIQ